MMELFENDNNLMEFCNSMHTNIHETLKMWGDVLSQGVKHGWCNDVNFNDKDLYYATQILLSMCASRLHNCGNDVTMNDLEEIMSNFLNDTLGVEFKLPEKDEKSETDENEVL
jgi:hypothetical protein